MKSDRVISLKSRRCIEDLRCYLRGRDNSIGSGKDLMQSIADQFAEDQGTIPVSPLRVARQLGMELKFGASTEQLGKLIPRVGGFTLAVYRGALTRAEQESAELYADLAPLLTKQGRFTIAHEIGHSFFYEDSREGRVPRRLVPQPIQRDAYWREEGLCHEFARALLVPEQTKHLIPQRPTSGALVGACKAYGVSVEVLLRRVMHDWSLWDDHVAVNLAPEETDPIRTVILGRAIKGRSAVWSKARSALAEHARCGDLQELAGQISTKMNRLLPELILGRSEMWLTLQIDAPSLRRVTTSQVAIPRSVNPIAGVTPT